MSDDRIWLEPKECADPYTGRQWCEDNPGGYDEADIAAAEAVALREQVRLLREALSAMRTMMDRGPKPRKLDDALAWVQNDDLARSLCDAALAATAPKEPADG